VKYERAKKTYTAAKNPSEKQTQAYRNAKKKLSTAMRLFQTSPVKVRKPGIVRNTPVKRKRQFLKPQLNLSTAIERIKELEVEVQRKATKLDAANRRNLKLTSDLYHYKLNEFCYNNIQRRLPTFEYLCGLTLEKFDMVMECVKPYLHLIPYPKCNVSENLFTYNTQLLSTLTICRHGLDLKFMAFIMDTSESTIQRMFNGWVIFLATIFNRLDLTPGHGYLLHKMPNAFINTAHGLTDIIIDATEFKFQLASNFELSGLMFSHYKNTTTGKALIGIAPHGMGLLFSDIYPGSISDSEITEKSRVLQFVEEEHEIMSDKGFSIQDLCAKKGVFLNRPKQKENDQFTEGQVQRNFDIASTRIHVERYIGRVRNWTILNTFKSIGHTKFYMADAMPPCKYNNATYWTKGLNNNILYVYICGQYTNLTQCLPLLKINLKRHYYPKLFILFA
jgi:hypothetical protein